MKTYTIEFLLKILNLAMNSLVENEICSYCKIFHDRDHRCKSGNHCKDLIFEGMKCYIRENSIREKKNDA